MSRKGPSTVGGGSFDPDRLSTDGDLQSSIHEVLAKNDLASAVRIAFSIPKKDSYKYRATTTVTLEQVQSAINAGAANGLHAWYVREEEVDEPSPEGNDEASTTPKTTKTMKKMVRYPLRTEIMSYVKLFDPSKPGANLLKGFKANAKKSSLQESVAEHLYTHRYIDTTKTMVIPREKKGHPNIYSDFWAWSCFSLQWMGPDQNSARSHTSHPALVVLMHHFGCVCPSYEALEIIRVVAGGRTVLDVGSGNGYWTYMLRRHGCETVAVDNMQSEWRTIWIGDTVREDGVRYIKRRPGSAEGDVLLLVYPVVGLEFTTSILDAYQGDVICVAGTQNNNRYTAFKDETIDQWMGRERPEFERLVQVPLPSFAGKDDALFIWQRRKQTATSE